MGYRLDQDDILTIKRVLGFSVEWRHDVVTSSTFNILTPPDLEVQSIISGIFPSNLVSNQFGIKFDISNIKSDYA